MDISVIIVSYNTKKLTLTSIESVEKTSKSLNCEIIVVDNNSNDGSVSSLEKLKREKRIKLIKNKENLGFSKANNQGIKIADGKHILLLNSDTKVKNDAILNLFEFAQSTKDAGVVGAKLLNRDGSVQPSCLRFPSVTNAVREYFLNQTGFFRKYAPKGTKPVEVDALVGACFLITKKALEKVGVLDKKYFFYYEDIDYCRRVWKKGLKVYYLPSAQVVHYHGASGKMLAEEDDQWRRLIPSSKNYHGRFGHYLLTAVLWLGQKWQMLLKK